jgi:hypothetical protein
MIEVTLGILLVVLAIFGWLVVRYRNIRSFEFQISIFVILYIAGEVLEVNNVTSLLSLQYIGSEIHLASAVLLLMILWFRLYYARKSGRRMIDTIE